MRDYIDGLDGSIYRERHQTHSSGHVANPSSFGWMMDGVCDGFGDFFRFLAFVVVLQRYLASNGAKSQLAGYQYQLVSDLESSMCHKEKGEATISPDWRGRVQRLWLVYRRSLIIMGCVSLQALMTSIIWNYFVINYHAVLETDVAGAVNQEAVVETQNSILTSSAMWMVSYFWRLANIQNVTQLQLLAILYNKEVDLLLSCQLLGFLPPLLVSAGAYVHLTYAADAVKKAAMS